MPLRIKTKGGFKNAETFLKRAKKFDPMPVLERYGEIGVDALANATPVDTGLTAASWYYEIEKTKNGYILSWNNSNLVQGANIALLIQFGHGTPSGTYVQGIDYINPALKNIFDEIQNELWREVSST